MAKNPGSQLVNSIKACGNEHRLGPLKETAVISIRAVWPCFISNRRWRSLRVKAVYEMSCLIADFNFQCLWVFSALCGGIVGRLKGGGGSNQYRPSGLVWDNTR